ncbi:MAG: HDOD domain-containing protein [Phycisphaeraceae bacterium]|nr:HDOD domain-containing protein [Phycisphaeraceae bacterium]
MISLATPETKSSLSGGSQPERSTSVRRFVARQPIFDRQQAVFGYELLFRSGMENAYSATDGELATARVIHDALNIIGLHHLVGEAVPFVNFPAASLIRGDFKLLPPMSVVEVLETVEPTQQVIEACRQARHQGYMLALDDFVYSPGYEPLIDLADIIKIDFMANPTRQQREMFIRGFHRRNTCLLAEKVETHRDYREAMELGYGYAQGYFFSKPNILSGRDIPAFKRNYLMFLAEVSHPELDFDRLEKVIKTEMSLSYKLLRQLNSAHFGFSNRIESVKHAMLLLGEIQLRKWAALVAVTCLAEDKPAELTRSAMVRARFCETSAADLDMPQRRFDLFLLGMLSMLDAVMDQPLHEALEQITLPIDVKTALLGGRNSLGDLLMLLGACEQGDLALFQTLACTLEIDPDHVAEHYTQAIRWTNEVFEQQPG